MTKTLHLYEPHFISMVEECLASEHKLMATAVLEPFMGDASEAEAGPGAFVGGYNFSLSCGCLVQVLSAKPYTGGYLVRIRGEARLGISGLPQTGPYMRAQASERGEGQRAELRVKVEQLRDIMRDVQNLASKFRCDETAALQQAMRWLHGTPITPGIEHSTAVAAAATHGSLAAAAPEPPQPDAAPGTAHDSDNSGDVGTSSSSSSSSSNGSRKGGNGGAGESVATAAAALALQPPAGSHPAATSSSSSSGRQSGPLTADGGGGGGGGGGGESASTSQSGVQVQQLQQLPQEQQQQAQARTNFGAGVEEAEAAEEEEEFDPEEAVRLSWASLQWLPHASTEERMYLVRTRLLAMDTRDVGRRLDLALEAMGAARASLAAKCAIKAVQ
ncbi:hypothetical protein PLESTB_000718500 [Pleodorina starrii]|uniref:Lon N-terminal domain-containing protein n=1 Tax=Pleodorina starrii TaxID=330485 RepID=A0A9W6BJZ6_9CHLO|nr:hypothetical protein PLESTB_000718500 [Pleodorina starrii]